MLRALYTSATGMKAQEYMIDNTANNLANVNTNGFKRSQIDFADLIYITPREAGVEVGGAQQTPTGLQIGTGVRPVGTTKSFSTGALEQTGNELDIAIEGDGFLRLLLPNGEVRYTRDGAIRRDGNGNLVTGDGYAFDIGVNQIPLGASQIAITATGNVSALQDGVQTAVGNLQLARFPNPAGLMSEGGNLYRATPASGAEVVGTPGSDGLGQVRQSFLERSNVEVVTELVSLITAQRAYEVNARAIRAGDEMLSVTNEIVR